MSNRIWLSGVNVFDKSSLTLTSSLLNTQHYSYVFMKVLSNRSAVLNSDCKVTTCPWNLVTTTQFHSHCLYKFNLIKNSFKFTCWLIWGKGHSRMKFDKTKPFLNTIFWTICSSNSKLSMTIGYGMKKSSFDLKVTKSKVKVTPAIQTSKGGQEFGF